MSVEEFYKKKKTKEKQPSRASKKTDGMKAVEFLKEKAAKRVGQPKRYIDLSTPEGASQITGSACWRPDIYLNNDRSCDECYIKDTCICPIKKIKRKKKKK